MSRFTVRNASRPEAGFYLVRLLAKGWAVPAEVKIIDGYYYFEVDGVNYPMMTPLDLDERVAGWLVGKGADPVTSLLMRGETCTEAVYSHRLALKAWAQEHSPHHPCLHPMRKINLALINPGDF